MLGDIIKNARQSKRIMQKELADMLEVRPSTVSMWEAGTRTPELPTLVKISEILDIPFSEIIDDIFGEQKKSPAETDESEIRELFGAQRTRTEWIKILSGLSRENKEKLLEYARLLLLSQAQADREDPE